VAGRDGLVGERFAVMPERAVPHFDAGPVHVLTRLRSAGSSTSTGARAATRADTADGLVEEE